MTTDTEPPETGPPNDEDVSATISPDNTAMAEAIFADGKEREQERREELTDAERDKQAIFDAIERETCRVRIGPKPVEFSVLWGDDETYIEDAVGEFIGDDTDEDDLTPEKYERYQNLTDNIERILADHAADETFDREFFEKLPQAKCEKAIMDLRSGGIEGERAGN